MHGSVKQVLGKQSQEEVEPVQTSELRATTYSVDFARRMAWHVKDVTEHPRMPALSCQKVC